MIADRFVMHRPHDETLDPPGSRVVYVPMMAGIGFEQ
jgi:hypothetical protein